MQSPSKLSGRLSILVSVLVLAIPSALAQSDTFIKTYCINGVSTEVGYSWWLDLHDDFDVTSQEEPKNAFAPPLPRGSGASELAAALVTEIEATACHAQGRCVGGDGVEGSPHPGTCIGGDPSRIGFPCSTHFDCSSLPPMCVEAIADRSCFTVTSPVAFSLYVGPEGDYNDCKVDTRGCRYNPTIRLMGRRAITPRDAASR